MMKVQSIAPQPSSSLPPKIWFWSCCILSILFIVLPLKFLIVICNGVFRSISPNFNYIRPIQNRSEFRRILALFGSQSRAFPTRSPNFNHSKFYCSCLFNNFPKLPSRVHTWPATQSKWNYIFAGQNTKNLQDLSFLSSFSFLNMA